MTRVTLHKGRERRPLAGHPWIYQGEIQWVEKDPAPGELVEVRDARDRFVGRGYINPRSQISVRLLTWQDEAIDEAFMRRRVQSAIDLRKRCVADVQGYRVIFGEADLLPGLIVDRYGDILVVQFLTAGIEALSGLIVSVLLDLLRPSGIYARNDAPARELERLQRTAGFLHGQFDTLLQISEGGVRFWVDVAAGQKTGLFLDQRENRLRLRAFAEGREALDAFCYTGGFGLHAAVAGARSVLGIELSKDAAALAVKNAELNGLGETIQVVEGNAFDELRSMDREGRRFDLIVLDPPAFTKGKEALDSALRGYKEINLRAMKLLREEGILVTCSCSYHLSTELFREMLVEAAADAHRRFRLVEFRRQAQDHPVLLSVRETSYLKCAILEAL
ncbi:MAG: class I SAM-dependent rRNA methyltransferase, partial [Acidobacteria bacterium]|nr:class I SAM-dependent rRNA methyltransferase [Acidobacteriota bacterium]